jgi:hypothetical protein
VVACEDTSNGVVACEDTSNGVGTQARAWIHFLVAYSGYLPQPRG